MYQTTSFDDSILSKRIDEAWQDFGLLKRGGKEVFSNLSVVMLGILVIIHSNADCERIFSLVKKKKKKDPVQSQPEYRHKCQVSNL